MTVNVGSGTAPFTYQWNKNGIAIPGATTTSYVIPWAQVSINGAAQTVDTYSAIVANSVGSVTATTSLTVSAVPVNDSFVNATTITGPAAIVRGINVAATKEASEPLHASNTGGSSVWWKWTAPTTGWYTVDTIGSSFDTLLGVYTGAAVYALTAVGSNDDVSSSNTASSVTFNVVTAGTTYYFAVDGKKDAAGNVATGTLQLQVTNQSDFISPFGFASFAGSSAGAADGTGSAAKFNSPSGLAVDSAGNIYVADKANNAIRMITSAGVVTTLAGTAGTSNTGSADGTGNAAKFNGPSGVAVDPSGNVFVADTTNNTIRKIASGGVVTTFAGAASSPGALDNAVGISARFNGPKGIAADRAGNIYVADTSNHTIRMITPYGGVSTLAGIAGAPGSQNGTGTGAQFNSPTGVAVDGANNVYVADTGNQLIRKITPAGVVTTVAGLANTLGTTDGLGTAARFYNPTGIAVDPAGNLYVGDLGSSAIRYITIDGQVRTLNSAMVAPGLAFNTGGNLFVADSTSSVIRKGTRATAAPVITVQPTSQSAMGGQSVTLSAAGTGWPSVSLQWFKNGVAITGANRATLTFATLQFSDAGTYVLVATNSAGTTTSSSVTITVTGTPAITVPPVSQRTAIGGTASFSVTATGVLPFTYQWQLNGVNIPGATSATYSIANVTAANLGTYTVVITNGGGNITSTPATLAVVGNADLNGDGSVDLIWQNMVTGERTVWLMNGSAFLGSLPLGTISTDWSIVATGDFNGDGNSDLLWQNNVSGECLIWLLNGTAYASSVSLGMQPRYMQIAGTGDFNGDGKTDILWQNTLTGEVSVWLSGATAYQYQTVSLGVAPLQLQVAGTGDFNADGLPDIVFSNTLTGEVSVWLNGTPFATRVSVGIAPAFWAVAGTGDLNGDSQTDIFFTNTSTGERWAWQMNGTIVATTVPLGTVPLNWVLNRPLIRRAAADFNADGNSDLVWQNSSTGERVIWLMDGTTYGRIFYFGVAPVQWTIAALGDMNGDGLPDILWQNTITGERVIWLMDGTTYLASVYLGVITTDWSFAGSGDFNGDGHTDILWQNTVTGERAIWFMNGTSYIGSLSLGGVPTNLQIVGTGDFDRDGNVDILWQDTTTQQVSVWLMNGTTHTSTVAIHLAATNQRVVGTGDFNGDGQPDIVLQDTATGDRTVWLMNGTTFGSSVTFTNVATVWSIRN